MAKKRLAPFVVFFVSEIFYSVQGEGELTGIPSVFMRLSGCNLRCRWCDTMYASWEPEGTKMSLDEILAEVGRHPAAHVVLTGGEPMIAKNLPELAAALRAAGKHITIETAGTVLPGGIACDLASLSPKLSHSNPLPGEISPEWIERHEATRLQPEILRAWIDAYPFQLKFVVSSAGDIAEIEALLAAIESVGGRRSVVAPSGSDSADPVENAWATTERRPPNATIPPHKVLLMPEGIDQPTLESRRELLLAACREKGYRYCERLHVALFGHRRGT